MWDINLILLVQNSILVISYFNLGGQVTNGSNLYVCDTFYIESIFLYTMQESFWSSTRQLLKSNFCTAVFSYLNFILSYSLLALLPNALWGFVDVVKEAKGTTLYAI